MWSGEHRAVDLCSRCAPADAVTRNSRSWVYGFLIGQSPEDLRERRMSVLYKPGESIRSSCNMCVDHVRCTLKSSAADWLHRSAACCSCASIYTDCSVADNWRQNWIMRRLYANCHALDLVIRLSLGSLLQMRYPDTSHMSCGRDLWVSSSHCYGIFIHADDSSFVRVRLCVCVSVCPHDTTKTG